MLYLFKILTIGDSHTAGYPGYDPTLGGNPESSYQHWMEKSLKQSAEFTEIEIVNLGQPGEFSNSIVNRLIDYVQNSQTTINIVIFNGGTNDLNEDPATIPPVIQNITKGIEEVRKHDIPIILTSIFPVKNEKVIPTLILFRDTLMKFVDEKTDSKIAFLDWFSYLKDENGVLKPELDSGDGEHVTIEGYKIIGINTANFIKTFLQRIKDPAS